MSNLQKISFENEVLSHSELNEEALVNLILPRVRELLKEEKHLLFAYLYRIDVSEDRVRNSIHSSDAAEKIAALIIHKLKEKLYWRNKYKKNS